MSTAGEFSSALVVDDLADVRAWLADALREAFPGIEVELAASLGEAMAKIGTPPRIALPAAYAVAELSHRTGRESPAGCHAVTCAPWSKTWYRPAAPSTPGSGEVISVCVMGERLAPATVGRPSAG